MAKEYTTAITTYNKIPHDAMKLNKEQIKVPTEFQLLEQQDEELILSTLKKSEKEDRYLLRCYNAGNKTTEGKFILPENTQRVHFTKLNESIAGKTGLHDRKIQFAVKKNEVKGILF